MNKLLSLYEYLPGFKFNYWGDNVKDFQILASDCKRAELIYLCTCTHLAYSNQ